jgi:hypothetical protein
MAWPAMWKAGEAVYRNSPGRISYSTDSIVTSALSMPCGCSTPLGRPVVPLVNASPRTSVSATTTSGSTSAPPANSAS